LIYRKGKTMSDSNLPPGLFNAMIEAQCEGPCAVCANAVEDCCCPECSVCGEQGNPKCYEARAEGSGFVMGGHGLKLNKEQALSRQRGVIRAAEGRLFDEMMALGAMENGSVTEWELSDLPDPWS
jgi:hypothetical protein